MTTSHGGLLARAAAATGTLLVLLTAAVQVASAQSLGEVARRDAERRTKVTAGRVYTNADLPPADASAPSPAPDAAKTVEPGAPASGTPGPGEEAAQADNPGVETIVVEAPANQNEQYWRTKEQTLQARLAKTTSDIAAGEAGLRRIDAASQTPATAREREVITATLDRLRRDAGSLRDELALLATRAGLADAKESAR